MKTDILDTYLFKALHAYPYDLPEAIESLNYALSSDSGNTLALCLKGRIFAEQLKDYEQAKRCYQEALSVDIYALEVYPYFIMTLIWNEDYEEAQRLIDFAMTVKGIDKALILRKQTLYYESLQRFEDALTAIKQARLANYDLELQLILVDDECRIKEKVKLFSGPKKDKKEKKGIKKTEKTEKNEG